MFISARDPLPLAKLASGVYLGAVLPGNVIVGVSLAVWAKSADTLSAHRHRVVTLAIVLLGIKLYLL